MGASDVWAGLSARLCQRHAALGCHDRDAVEIAGRPRTELAKAERWAADIGGAAYAIDDQTAIKATDGTVEVVSEGRWKLFS